MGWLNDLIEPRKRLAEQAEEIRQLRAAMARLESQNQSMRDGMRRCVTCDYRLDYKQRQESVQSAGAHSETSS